MKTVQLNKDNYEVFKHIGGQYSICLKGSFGGNPIWGGDPAHEDCYDKEYADGVFDDWDGSGIEYPDGTISI